MPSEELDVCSDNTNPRDVMATRFYVTTKTRHPEASCTCLGRAFATGLLFLFAAAVLAQPIAAQEMNIATEPPDSHLKIVTVAKEPSEAEAKTALRSYYAHYIVRFDGAQSKDIERVLGVRVENGNPPKETYATTGDPKGVTSPPAERDSVLRTIAVRRTQQGALHMYYGYSSVAQPENGSWQKGFDRWAQDEAAKAGKSFIVSASASVPTETSTPIAVESPQGTTAQRGAQSASANAAAGNAGDPLAATEAWTELASARNDMTTASGNESIFDYKVYRLNSNDPQFDYYMVVYSSEAIPNFLTGCSPIFCGWVQLSRDIIASVSTPAATPAALIDHGPTGTITTETTGFTIGGNLGFNSTGPTGGISASFSETWAQPSVTTIDHSNSTTADWHEDFTQASLGNVPGTSSGTFLSFQGAIFRVPTGTPSVSISYEHSTQWTIDLGASHGQPDSQRFQNTFSVSPPQFSVSPLSVVVASGVQQKFQVSATAPSSAPALGWTATATGEEWLTLGNTTGSGTCTSKCPIVEVNPGVPDGLVGFISFDTDPPSGSPSVSAGPIVVQVVSGHKARTTTTLTSSNSSVVQGQNVTFTVSVTSDKGSPTGSVTFLDGSASLQTVSLTNGKAVLNIGTLSTGSHSITASYGGDAAFLPSKSDPVSEAVTGNILANLFWWGIDRRPQYLGPIQYTFLLVPTSGPSIASGRITIFANGTSATTAELGPSLLSHILATTEPLGVGTFHLKAHWDGNNFFKATDAFNDIPGWDETITVIPASVSIALKSSATTAKVGDSVTLSANATITSSHRGHVDNPEGTVEFSDSGRPLATISLVNGNASFTTTSLNLGTHPILATFNGAPYYTAASSAVTNVSVLGNPTTVSLLVNPETQQTFGQPVTFTAQVTSTIPNSHTPTGTVTFFDHNLDTRQNGTLLTLPLSDGAVTSKAYSQLPGGHHSITCAYNADAIFAFSKCQPFQFTVNPAGSQTTLKIGEPSPTVYGEFIDLDVTVSNVNNQLLTNEAGTVTFKASQNTLPLGTVPLSGGKAHLQVSNVAAGENSITASWTGTNDYLESTSNPQPFAVSQAETATAVRSVQPSQVAPGQLVTVTYEVLILPPGGGQIVGEQVTIQDSSSPPFPDWQCTGPLTVDPHNPARYVGSCSFRPTSIGSRQLKSYFQALNDLNYEASVSLVGANLSVQPNVLANPSFSALTPSQTISAGTPSISLAGVISAGSQFPPSGEFVKVTIGSETQQAVIGSKGTFAIPNFAVKELSASPTPYAITYSYAGDANFRPARNSQTTLLVTNPTKTPTTTTIVSNAPNPAELEQLVEVAVKVSPTSGNETPTGSVMVSSDTDDSCSAKLAAGTGSCSLRLSKTGNRSLTAMYLGDSNFAPSTSPTATEHIGRCETLATLTSAPNPSDLGQNVTFSVTVRSQPACGIPTGNVTLAEHVGQEVRVLGQGNVSGGQVQFSINSLAIGAHEIDATYGGDNSHEGATSQSVNQAVNR